VNSGETYSATPVGAFIIPIFKFLFEGNDLEEARQIATMEQQRRQLMQQKSKPELCSNLQTDDCVEKVYNLRSFDEKFYGDTQYDSIEFIKIIDIWSKIIRIVFENFHIDKNLLIFNLKHSKIFYLSEARIWKFRKKII
jgi:hypothetical protein